MQKLSLVVLVFLMFAVGLSSVRAETFNVNVQYPARTPVARPYESAYATVTITYSGANHFLVGIRDASTGNYISPGGIFREVGYPYADLEPSNPPCHWHIIENLSCIVTAQESGTLNLRFYFPGGPSSPGEWNLEAVVTLADADFNPINSTVSVTPFTIVVYDVANVYVEVPQPVSVKLDGVSKGPGSFQVSLPVGSNHTLTVPKAVIVNGTKAFVLREFWGYDTYYYNQNLSLLNSTLETGTIEGPLNTSADANVTLDYVTMDRVAVANSPFNVSLSWPEYGPPPWQPSPWYQEGTYAYVSTVSSPQPMPGILGLLGVREVFDGWYVNGQYSNSTNYLSIPVSGPLTIEARWHVDYTMPIMIASVLALVVGVVGVNRSRRKLKHLAHGTQSTLSICFSNLDSRLRQNYWKWMGYLLILYVIIPDIYQAGPWAGWGLSWFAFGWEYYFGWNVPFGWNFPIQIALQNFSCLFSYNPSCLYVIAEPYRRIWEVMFNGLLFGVLVTVIPLLLIGLVMYKVKISSRRAFCCLVLGVLLSIIHVYGLYLGWSVVPEAFTFPYVLYNPLWHLYGLIVTSWTTVPFPVYVPFHTFFIILFTLLAYRNWSSIRRQQIRQTGVREREITG